MLEKYSALNAKLIRLQALLKPRPFLHRILWRDYISVNKRLLCLCKDLREYARFWSTFLTLLFGAFILIQCYCAYVMLYESERIGLIWMAFFSLVIVGLVVNELALVDQCARVVKYNARLRQSNWKFGLHYRSSAALGFVPVRNLLKVCFVKSG